MRVIPQICVYDETSRFIQSQSYYILIHRTHKYNNVIRLLNAAIVHRFNFQQFIVGVSRFSNSTFNR